MNILPLFLYTLSTFVVGWVVMNRWFRGLPLLLAIVGAFLLGTGISVPITYFLAVLFAKTGEPILWGTIYFILLVTGTIISKQEKFIAYCLLSIKKYRNSVIPLYELLLVIFAIVFSTWMMTKTFHGNAMGEVFVGSNNVFDFGHSLGIVRSFSWGPNIPFRSPFMAGLPFFYHFFFNFWAALWEYFGVPVIWAINIPSIVSFASLLIVIYYLPQIIAKQKPFVGWITVILAITNSSLTFWQLILQKGLSMEFVRTTWRLPTYPFAGPFDGSTISLFMTLNNYVNQRHLGFATAFGLFIILAVVRDITNKMWSMNKSVVVGIMTGFLLLWNMVTYILVMAVVGIFLIVNKRWKTLVVYIGTSGVIGLLFLLPIAGYLYKALFFLQVLVNSSSTQSVPVWNIIQYLWQNLGVLPFVGAIGFYTLRKEYKAYMIPFIFFFIGVCIFAALGKRGFEQKSLSFFIIGINMLAAIGLDWIWERKKYIARVCALFLFVILIISGVVDLMPIKNEFAFPLISKETLPVISWIHSSTPKNAVFVSYSDIIDPVVLAGRTNFFGFFGNVGWYDRSQTVQEIYNGNTERAKTNGISYILVPKWEKNDFRYPIDVPNLRKIMPIGYEDSRYIVFALP